MRNLLILLLLTACIDEPQPPQPTTTTTSTSTTTTTTFKDYVYQYKKDGLVHRPMDGKEQGRIFVTPPAGKYTNMEFSFDVKIGSVNKQPIKPPRSNKYSVIYIQYGDSLGVYGYVMATVKEQEKTMLYRHGINIVWQCPRPKYESRFNFKTGKTYKFKWTYDTNAGMVLMQIYDEDVKVFEGSAGEPVIGSGKKACGELVPQKEILFENGKDLMFEFGFMKDGHNPSELHSPKDWEWSNFEFRLIR